jgi:outer membrane protein TolC
MKKILGLFALFFAVGDAAWGTDRPLSMQEAEARALSANPRLQAARLDALAARKRTAQTFGRHFGQLDFTGTYNHYNDARTVRPIAGPLSPAVMGNMPFDDNQVHYGITWQIPLLTAGGLYEGDRIARLSQSAAENLAVYTREEIRYNVRATYRNALVLTHALAAVSAYEQALEKDDADAQLKVKVETWAKVDAAKVTFALESARARKATVLSQLQAAQALLSALIGEDPLSEGYVLQEVPGEPTAYPGNLSEHLQAAIAGRRDLMAARENTRIYERKKRLALEAFGPQLLLMGAYLRNDAPSLARSIGTNEVSLVLKFPVFNGLGNVYAAQEANASLLAARQRERARQLEIEAQVVEASGRREAARALYRAGRAQRDLGAEVAHVEHLKLLQGTGKMEDYLAARAQELDGEMSYWQGVYALQSAADFLEFVCARGGNHE